MTHAESKGPRTWRIDKTPNCSEIIVEEHSSKSLRLLQGEGGASMVFLDDVQVVALFNLLGHYLGRAHDSRRPAGGAMNPVTLDSFLTGLDAKAKAATPGPRRYLETLSSCEVITANGRKMLSYKWSPDAENRGNAALAAACDPDIIRLLVAVARAAANPTLTHTSECIYAPRGDERCICGKGEIEIALAALERHATERVGP